VLAGLTLHRAFIYFWSCIFLFLFVLYNDVLCIVLFLYIVFIVFCNVVVQRTAMETKGGPEWVSCYAVIVAAVSEGTPECQHMHETRNEHR
jgi:hypothetical protein